jgi:hypothetical protein
MHKMQGTTTDKIILSLGMHNIKTLNPSFYHVYVALTRVHANDGIRILICENDMGKPMAEILAHLMKLVPDVDLEDWLHGFTCPDGGKWDMNKALEHRKQRLDDIPNNKKQTNRKRLFQL